MRKLYSAFVGLTLLMAGVSQVWAVTLSLEPVATVAGPGDTVSLDLWIDGLTPGGPDSLSGFDIDIGFDPSRLSFSGYELGLGLGDISSFEAIDLSFGVFGGGFVNVAEISLLEADSASCFFCIPPFLDDIQSGTFVLATLDFSSNVLSGDSTIVSITNVLSLSDGFGQPLTLDSTAGATISNPAAVPEPDTWLLFVVGLGALVAVRRRLGSTSPF